MAVTPDLTALLQANLAMVKELPPAIAELRQKLMQSRPKHTAPVIKQSPENSLKIENSETE
jgi:hypothetical protein